MARRAPTGFRVASAALLVATVAALAWLIHPAPERRPWCDSAGAAGGHPIALAPGRSATRPLLPAGDHLDWLRVRLAGEISTPGCEVALTLRRDARLGGAPGERELARWTRTVDARGRLPAVTLPPGVAAGLRAGDPLELELRRGDGDPGGLLLVAAEAGAPAVFFGASEQASLWGGRRRGGAPSPWTVAVLAALALALAWRGPGPQRIAALAASDGGAGSAARRWDAASAALLGIAAVLAVVLHGRFPITWDEPAHADYGRHVLAYYTSGFRDLAALTYRNDYLYGGAYDLLGALVAGLAPAEPFRALHLLGALTGLAGVAACGWTARLLAGPRAGTAATALLLATPIWFGHAFNNPKDIPFASASAVALLCLVRVVQRWPAVPWRWTVALGIAAGLAAGVRVGGLVLLGYLAAVAAGHAALTLLRPGPLRSLLPRAAGPALRVALPAAAIGYAAMLAAWPWAQRAPLTRPWQALGAMSRFAWDGLVPYRGLLEASDALPASYAPTQLALQLPELVLPLVALAALAGLAAVTTRRDGWPRAAAPWAIVALAAGFPLAYVAIRGAVLYDGARHLLFVVPPLVVIAAAGLDRAWAAAARAPRWLHAPLVALLLAALAAPAVTAARMLPYPHAYYNAFVGGPRGAQGRYALDEWRSANAEGVALAVAHLAAAGELQPGGPPIRLWAFGEPRTATEYFPPGLVFEHDPGKAELAIYPGRWPYCEPRPPGTEIGTVSRLGIPWLVVLDHRGSGEAVRATPCATPW